MDRDWTEARAKVDAEEVCRLAYAHGLEHSGCAGALQAAHVLGRKHDEVVEGPRGGRRLLVADLDVVPLCERHHRLYDRHALDLLPYLTTSEQARAVQLVGMQAAWRRITGSREAAA